MISIKHFKSAGGEGEEGEIITSKDYAIDSPEKSQEGLIAYVFPFYTETPKSTPLSKVRINGVEAEKYFRQEKGYTFITYYIPVENSKYWSLFSLKATIRGVNSKELIDNFEKVVSSFELSR